ncbi:NADPH:quinone reductase [Microbacterium tumbae]
MRAIIYSENGPSDVLRLVDRPIPELGDGEVRVRIVVSGVNPTDWKSRAGSGSSPRDGGEQVPDQDGAGVVDAVGRGVAHLSAGDRVWVFKAAYRRPTGTAQEYAVLPAERVVALPDEASFDVGAALGVPALTAHRALTVHDDGPTRLAPGALVGRTVLVAGGAGAVGHAAIQLSRWAGATVVTTVSSPEKGALAAAAGAHTVIDYRREDAAARIREVAPQGVDLIVEVSPGRNAELDAAVLADRGAVAVYATDGDADLSLDVSQLFARNIRYQFILVYTMGDRASQDGVAAVTAALRDGALPVGEGSGLPLTRFPLEATAAAHDAVAGGFVGKVLIDVADASS